MSISGTAKLGVNLQLTEVAALDLSNVTNDILYSKILEFTNGTAANQANKVFHDQRTLTASATENLDLAGGLTDAYGAAITFTRIKAIIVFAAAANTNNVIVGGAASNQFVGPFGDVTDTVAVRPGGLMVFAAPDATSYAVTAGTGDILKVANSAGSTSVVYDILIVGTV
jgi:hypothetical protein